MTILSDHIEIEVTFGWFPLLIEDLSGTGLFVTGVPSILMIPAFSVEAGT